MPREEPGFGKCGYTGTGELHAPFGNIFHSFWQGYARARGEQCAQCARAAFVRRQLIDREAGKPAECVYTILYVYTDNASIIIMYHYMGAFIIHLDIFIYSHNMHMCLPLRRGGMTKNLQFCKMKVNLWNI